MARLIPQTLPEGTPASEWRVFDALSGLSDSWTVLSNVPVGLFGRPTARLNQIDFLLIHEHHGIIVLEVKGGAIKAEDGKWWTQPRGKTEWIELDRSPFDQAADQRFALQRYVTEKLRVDRKVFAHAVSFPATVVTSDLGSDAPRGLIIDIRDLEHPASAIQRVRDTWGTCPRLSPGLIDRVVAELKPTFSMPVVSAALAAETTHALERETRRQAMMVESQVAAYQTLLSTDRVVVVGGAGTGKTVIAAQLAEQLTSTGNRTLLLCHRAGVQAFLHTLLANSPAQRKFELDSPDLLKVTTWPGLLSAVAKHLGKSPTSTRSSAHGERFLEYRDHATHLFDAIVIDEGQEFTAEQVEALEWLLTQPEESPLYVFADPFQHSGLFSTGRPRLERTRSKAQYRWTPQLEAPLVALSTNCRNSNPIAQIAARFYPYTAPQALVEGPAPVVHRVARSQVVAKTIELVKRLVTDEGFQRNQLLLIPIGISPKDLEKAAHRAGLEIAAISQLYRYPLTPRDLRVPMGIPDEVQGLEADVTVVAYFHSEDVEGTDRDIYIAASRARSILHIVTNLSEDEIVALAARFAERAKQSPGGAAEAVES